MTIDEAIKRIESTECFLKECSYENIKNTKFPEFMSLIKDEYEKNKYSLDSVITFLRAQAERDNPQPLTLDELENAKSTIEQIYEEYLFSEIDTVDLRAYDEELQQVHSVLEKMLAYRYPPKEAHP